jgi:Domain of unknown function (DUF5666)
MSTAIPYGGPEEDWDRYEGEELALPGRSRRRFLNPVSAALIALVLGAIGFYVGVRVEKGQLSNSSSSASLAAGLRAAAGAGASRLAGARAGASAARGGASAAGAGGAGVGAGGAGAGAAAAGFAGGRGAFLSGAIGGGNSSFGTVSSVDGKNIYVTEAGNGNVVKVQLSGATKITKSVGVSKSAVRPGDAVVVQGLKNSGGTVSATSVSDSGARANTSGTGSSKSSSGPASAVSSLFGGGG